MIQKLPSPGELEKRTQRIGKELFAGISTSGPFPFTPAWFDDILMSWSMSDEQLKVQLFRFIDVLPMLTRDDQVCEHVQAYFSKDIADFPRLVRWGLPLVQPGTSLGTFIARLIRSNSERLAKRFIAGTTPAEVIQTLNTLRRKRQAFTLDLLGEATLTESEADGYLAQYLDLLDHLAREAKSWPADATLDLTPTGPLPAVNVSVKVSALNSQFDPIDPAGSISTSKRRLREILRAARRLGAFVNLDMEQYAFKDLTLETFRSLLMEPEFRDWPNVGIAMQAYLPETELDLVDLLAWVKKRGTPVWVRLVKGAYWDYETVLSKQKHWPIPVYTQKWESDASFERCVNLLMEEYTWLRPALASHNLRSLSYSLALAEHWEVPKTAYEIQMLFGMGDEIKQVFVDRGERLRIYTPFGQLLPGMAYLVRRLLENTSNTSFLRATFKEHTSAEKLLLPPAPAKVNKETKMAPAQKSVETLAPFVNTPVMDFSRRLAREELRQALDQVRSEFGKEYPPIVSGVAKTGRPLLASRNPANLEEIVGQIGLATRDDAEEAVQSALRAADNWRRTSVLRRADVLVETARKMRERRCELAAWMVYECGKQWREADADVAEAIDFCEYYARSMLDLSSPRQRNVPGEDNEYFYYPRGVTVAISPWNFPLAILVGMTVAPLVAGNTVICKPAEQSSVIAAKFFEILSSCNLPTGVCQFLPGIGEEVGAYLSAHPSVAVVNFTGSVNVGQAIMKAAAENTGKDQLVKHVVAEMGGKNAIIVDDDADLDEAVRGVLFSAFGYAGQKCSACSRVIIHERIYDAFIARLRESAKSLTIGPAEDPSFSIGPVIDREAQSRLQSVLERAKRECEVLFAGEVSSLEGIGSFVSPTIFAGVPETAEIAQQELFGPVLAIFKSSSIEDALRLANQTRYALTGGIFSRNPVTVEKVKREFLVGNLYINRKITGAEVDRQPFGGFKLSGMGAKAGGPDYLRQFLVARTVTENTLRRGFAPEESIDLA